MTYRTEDELLKMTKRELIIHIMTHEVHPKVRENTGLTFGQVAYIEQMGKSIQDKSTCFRAIISARTDENGDLEIVIPQSQASIDKFAKDAAPDLYDI